MIGKMNISRIIGDHAATLKHEHSGKSNLSDFIFFYGVSVLLGGLLVFFEVIPNRDIVGVLATCFSVFAALLFNLLLLVYDIVRKESDAKKLAGIKARFLKELYSNIAYAILVSLFVIVLLVAYFLAEGHSPNEKHRLLEYGLVFLIYSLSIHFVLTMLLILKRVHTLLSKEFDKPLD